MSTLQIFMSHSSRDKAFVRRLNRDLRSQAFRTWLDEEDIPFGSSISEEIQNGLDTSDVLFVFLSEHAVASRWLATEWQSKFFQQMQVRQIPIVPILLGDCRIPTFLSDKRYVDFRRKEDYDANLSAMLRFLSNVRTERAGERMPSFDDKQGIFAHKKEILDDLETEHVSLPTYRRLLIVRTLRRIPRSGKSVRLAEFKPRLRIRSIYDHILSLAHLADCILPHINHGIHPSELGDLSLCIAYHELNEVILGDIPSYTSLSNNKRNRNRNYAEQRLRNVSPQDRERIANEVVWMFLSDKHKQAFGAAMKLFADQRSRVHILFKSLDKLDPIVSVWRYIHHYRGKLGPNPQIFNHKMKDFFENPDVKSYMRANKIDARLIDMVINLQDRRKAWDYYEDPDRIFSDERLFQIPKLAVRKAIEGIPLFGPSMRQPS
jgi:5'-deoxynucleotidase YfbR-like HD superfamily hydrolase